MSEQPIRASQGRKDKALRCPIQSGDNAEILLAYVDRKLDPETAAVLDRHVEGCMGCRQLLASQRMVWEALDSWEAESVSTDFNRRLYRRIENEEGRWWRRLLEPAFPWSMKPAMPVAAACLVLVAAFLFRTPGGWESGLAGRQEVVDVEQVELTLEDLEMLRQLGVDLDSRNPATL